MSSAYDTLESGTKRLFDDEVEGLDSKSSNKRCRKHAVPQGPSLSPRKFLTSKQGNTDILTCKRSFLNSLQSEFNPKITNLFTCELPSQNLSGLDLASCKQSTVESAKNSLLTSKHYRHSFSLEKWLEDTSTETLDQQKRLANDPIAKILDQQKEEDDSWTSASNQRKSLPGQLATGLFEEPFSLPDSIFTRLGKVDDDDNDENDENDERMSQQTNPTVSTEPTQSEKINPGSSAYWVTLRLNDLVFDPAGLSIPDEVKTLIDKHIRKQRDSPPLDHQDQVKIKDLVGKSWHKNENVVSKIIRSPLFDLDSPTLAEGGNTLWSKQPLPKNPNAPRSIHTPKPDKHFGFRQGIDSDWSEKELSVTEHPFARPFIQPSRENIFPCLILEIKAEASKGNLYAAEAQAAGAGAHRVASLLWFLDEVDPGRERTSTDALAFTTVINQRQAVVHVHFFNPADKIYYMSFIDSFYFVKDADARGCRDHHKNVTDWMLKTLQPLVRDLLTKAYPISEAWTKQGRTPSTMGEGNKSSAGNDKCSKKSKRKGPATKSGSKKET